MNVLIVHAHPEPDSFNGAMTQRAIQVLTDMGHTVTVSDLYAMGFDPVSDRRNFTTVADPGYFKPQAEEAYASTHNGFTPTLEAEIQKLEQCDALILQFPLWWFSVPAILKGWIDRVFAYQRIYGGGKLYENGIGQGKRALLSLTTGGPHTMYSGYGLNPGMHSLTDVLNHGIFWFNGFQPLTPYVAYSPAHLDDADRAALLDGYEARLRAWHSDAPITMLPSTDFQDFSGYDTVPQYMVTLTRCKPVDETFMALVPQEQAYVASLKQQKKLLHITLGADLSADDWHGWMLMRTHTATEARQLAEGLPLASYFTIQVQQATTHTPLKTPITV
jgi:NAD(P)H dehydrogenase (quinone)